MNLQNIQAKRRKGLVFTHAFTLNNNFSFQIDESIAREQTNRKGFSSPRPTGLSQKNESEKQPLKGTIRIGDSIRINLTGKDRVQMIQGIVTSYHKSSQTIKIRRIFQEVGFERMLSLYSPQIKSIQIVKRSS